MGYFLDINIDALLHVSDLSHGRVKKPVDLVTIGQKLKVKITKIDKDTNRVSICKSFNRGSLWKYWKKIQSRWNLRRSGNKIMDYGCFVKIEDGIEGLIHSSELDWTNRKHKT